MERVAGEDSYEQASETIVPVGGQAQFPSQFEFGADDKHNWQGFLGTGLAALDSDQGAVAWEKLIRFAAIKLSDATGRCCPLTRGKCYNE